MSMGAWWLGMRAWSIGGLRRVLPARVASEGRCCSRDRDGAAWLWSTSLVISCMVGNFVQLH